MPTLHDGREVASDSEDWKLECLARYVLRRPSRALMNEWLLDFHKQAGAAAESSLRARMNAIRAADTSGRQVTKPVTSRAPKASESDLFGQILA